MYIVQIVVRFLNQVQLQLFVGGLMSYLRYVCGMLRDNAILIFASDKMKHFKVYQWLFGHYICGLGSDH